MASRRVKTGIGKWLAKLTQQGLRSVVRLGFGGFFGGFGSGFFRFALGFGFGFSLFFGSFGCVFGGFGFGFGSFFGGFLLLLFCFASLFLSLEGSFVLALLGLASLLVGTLLSLAGFLLSLQLGFLLVAEVALAEEVELHLGLDLRLVHLVGIGEREGAAEVHPLARGVEVTLGDGTIADDVDGEVARANKFIGCARDMGMDFADGQLAAEALAHDGGTGLRDVDLERGRGGDRTDVFHIHDTTDFEGVGGSTAGEVFVILVEGEIEVECAGGGGQAALELLLLIEHIEGTGVVERAEGVELFHHEALDGELLDDAFLAAALGFHVVDIEMDAQLRLLLQTADGAAGSNLQLLVGGIDADIVKAQRGGVATEAQTEEEGFGEVLEHGCEGSRDVLEDGAAMDERRAESEGASLLLVGQLDESLVEA